MVNEKEIISAIPYTIKKTNFKELTNNGYRLKTGKVRDMYIHPNKDTIVMVTTDRISAFDRIIGAFPYKGEVLTQLAEYGFRSTLDIIPNHMKEVIDPQIMIIEKCDNPIPLEMVVRGHLTGSGYRAWKSKPYLLDKNGIIKRDAEGKPIPDKNEKWAFDNNAFVQGYGIILTEDMFENGVIDLEKGELIDGAKFKKPIVTPTTKSDKHDQPLTEDKATLLSDEYSYLKGISLKLYMRGVELAAEKGLLFPDTKYEFGKTKDGEIKVIDEVNTPDSSRYWIAEGFEDRLLAGEKQKGLDKEFTRQFLMKLGFQGEGKIPKIPISHIVESVNRYLRLLKIMTDREPVSNYTPDPILRMKGNLEEAINSGIIEV